MTHSTRFIRLAQLLFTSQIPEDERAQAKQLVEHFKKSETDLQSWVDTIENNLNVFENYHGNETALVIIAEKFEETMEKQKQHYEKIINELKKIIEALGEIKDVEIQEMIINITSASEEFSEIFNELIDLPVSIGETGFIQKFKDASKQIISKSESFLEVIQRVRDYIMKNVLHEFSLS